MIAEPTVTTWFAGLLLLWDTRYEPRHRSKRQAGHGIVRYGQRGRERPAGAGVGRPPWPGWATDLSSPRTPHAEPDFLGQLAREKLLRVVEDCALDDLTRIIPEIVQVIVHSPANTMTTAWHEFREATRNSRALRLGSHRWLDAFDSTNPGPYPGEDAVVLKLGQAHEPLWLITNGPPATR
jgi:hypothetical protein